MSKYEPAVGDVGVIGTVRVTRNKFQQDFAIGGWGFFDADITANGYASVAQNIRGAALRLECLSVPDGINDGDAVTADIVQGNYAAYATNIIKL